MSNPKDISQQDKSYFNPNFSCKNQYNTKRNYVIRLRVKIPKFPLSLKNNILASFTNIPIQFTVF